MNTPARPPMVHNVKCIDPFFTSVKQGLKTFELRKDDRDYQVGDTLALHHWIPLVDGGRYGDGGVLELAIEYKLKGFQGLQDDWCILGLSTWATDPVDLITLLFDINDALCWSRVPVGGEVMEYHPKGSQQEQLRAVHDRVSDRLMKRNWTRGPGGPVPGLVPDMVPRVMVTWLQQQLDATVKVADYLKTAAFSDEPWTEKTEAGFRKLMDAAKEIAANPPQL